MRQIAKRAVRTVPMRILAVGFLLAAVADDVRSATIFESGTLGPIGVPFDDLGDLVPGTNVNPYVFPGVRFELTQTVVTSQIGGHFAEETPGTFFGAIVKLDDGSDFPNSIDLSTPDVFGATTLRFPNPSAEVFGNLNLTLNPGWYAVVFGSGLFGTSGSGGAVRNGMDIGEPSYIGFDPNLGWSNLDIFQTFFDNHRFVVKGTFVPESSTATTVMILAVIFSLMRQTTRST